jgi:hypothetical protein
VVRTSHAIYNLSGVNSSAEFELKGQLEMPLRVEVCAGTSDLIAGQQEIVMAWIAAMSRHLGSRRDLRRDDGSRLASARPPSGLTERATMGEQLVLNDMLASCGTSSKTAPHGRCLSSTGGKANVNDLYIVTAESPPRD